MSLVLPSSALSRRRGRRRDHTGANDGTRTGSRKGGLDGRSHVHGTFHQRTDPRPPLGCMDLPECALVDKSAAIAHPGAVSTVVNPQDPQRAAVLAGDERASLPRGGGLPLRRSRS